MKTNAFTRRFIGLLFITLLGLSPRSSLSAPSVGRIDFTTDNGDLTVISTNNPGGPWTYDNFRGTWTAFDLVDCATPAFRSSRLNTPGWTVVSGGTVTLTFEHRYSWEADTTRWDGGQLRLSVNGAAYATVPLASFTANGYNNTIGGDAVPNSELMGQSAFTAESAGYADGLFITSVARLGTFNAGDTISVQFLGAWDDCAQGMVPNWEIDSIEFTPSLEDRRPPPSITNATLPEDAVVQEGKLHVLQAAVVGQTSLQWFKDGLALAGVSSLTYTIPSMSAADVGQYHLEAYNAIGTTVTRVATVTMIDDDTAPVIVIAYSDATDLTKFTLQVNEPLCVDELECGSDADDYFNYGVESLDGQELLEVASATVLDGTNVVLNTSAPRTPGRTYKLFADKGVGIGDLYHNVIPAGPASQTLVVEPLIFQQGVNGYNGTQDTELRGAAPGVIQGTITFVTVDAADGGGISQGLLRFGDLLGSAPGQIPSGSTILSARLTLTHGNGAGPDGDLVNVHRMLIAWEESTATYNSLGAGVTANGVEAAIAPDFIINSAGITAGAKLTFDVAASIQAWANGEANYGWAMLPTAGNGYRWDTSESTVAASQPRLDVIFTVPPCSAVSISQQPAPSTTVNEGGSFTLSVNVISQGCPPTFQWTRNGVDIPGATASSYAIASAHPVNNSGVYRVRVSNDLPSSVLSEAATVTVNADIIKPTVVSAVIEPNLVNLTVAYSEPVSATAESASNYSLIPTGGGAAISLSAARVDAKTIRLTAAALTFGTTYNLTVSGVTDLAGTPNTITTVVIPVSATTRRLLASDAIWKYEQNGNLDSTLDAGETPWHAPGYDDSGWQSGQGMFGLESSTVVDMVPLPDPLIRTPWTIGAAQLTYYLRTTLTVPIAPAGSVVALRHATDDGMVAYIDGVEAARYNMIAPQPVLNGQLAPAASPEGVVECVALTGASAGTHTLAVEVHQSATTSSDIVFGAEVLQLIKPRLSATRNPDGSVVFTWPNDPGWFLVQATDVAGPYTAVPNNPSSPFTARSSPASAYYLLRCR